jgi:hypothetical protein
VERSKSDQTASCREAEIDPPAFYSAIETTVVATRLVLRLPAATAHPPFGTQADAASQEHWRLVRIVGGQQLHSLVLSLPSQAWTPPFDASLVRKCGLPVSFSLGFRRLARTFRDSAGGRTQIIGH